MIARIVFGTALFALTAVTVIACSNSPSASSLPGVRSATADGNLHSGNLILNGGAELGDATLTGYDSVTIPGWSENGLPTVVGYGTKGFPQGTSGASNRQFFTGGPFSSSTLTQTVDVSSIGDAIDGNGVRFTLSASLGGKGSKRDDARVTATFRDASRSSLRSVTIGPVTAKDRKDKTTLLARSTMASLPAHTRLIDVTIHFTMYGKFVSGVSMDNGYADDVSLILSSPVPTPTMSPEPPSRVPKFDHVFFVYFENSNYDQIIGNTSQAPYINEVAHEYALLSNYYSLHHPSDANYVLQAAGGTYGLHQNDFKGLTINASHLADLVEKAGGTWKQYMQSANTACNMKAHRYYYPDDGPYMYFADVRNDPLRCKAHIVPYSQFAADLKSSSTTPTYAWLSPNDCSDMEACGIAAGDAYLKQKIMAPLLQSPAWKKERTLLIVSWDEDDFTPVNHVPAILVSRTRLKNGFASNVLYTHYSLLKTIEAAMRLPTLTKNDRYATRVDDVWR